MKNLINRILCAAPAFCFVAVLVFLVAVAFIDASRAQTFNIENRSNLPSRVLLPGKGGDLASGGTITPTNVLHAVTGITAVDTITAPAGIQAGQTLTLIPKGLFAITTNGNVIIGVTAVVNRALVLVWDGSKWVPTYLL